MRGHNEFMQLGLAPLAARLDDLDYLRDDLAALFDEDVVADLDSEPFDLIFVMKRSPRDGCPGKQHRLELGDRRQRADSSHLDGYVSQQGGCLPGGILVSDGPAWSLRGCAKLVLQRNAVDFYYDAVDFVWESFAFRTPLAAELDDLFDGFAEPAIGVDLESRGDQPVERLPVGFQRFLAGEEEIVTKDIELALSHDSRVQRLHRSAGRVTRVRKRGQSLFGPVFVDGSEDAGGKKYLAADLNLIRCFQTVLDRQRQRANRSYIPSNVFADDAVASGHATGQKTVFVDRRDAESVDLQLGRIFDLIGSGPFVDSLAPLAQFAVRIRIVEREHLSAMLIPRELIGGAAGDSLCRRVRRNQFGKIGFELTELLDELIVLVIADLGIVAQVVALIVVADELP